MTNLPFLILVLLFDAIFAFSESRDYQHQNKRYTRSIKAFLILLVVAIIFRHDLVTGVCLMISGVMLFSNVRYESRDLKWTDFDWSLVSLKGYGLAIIQIFVGIASILDFLPESWW